MREERRSLLLAPGENSQESTKENIPLTLSEGSLTLIVGKVEVVVVTEEMGVEVGKIACP